MSSKDIETLDERSINVIQEKPFTTFRDTYKVITYAMGLGMIYPNPETTKRRFICIIFLSFSVTPITCLILLDVYKYWQQRDIINIIRHGTVLGPFLAVFLKILILFYKRNKAKAILDEIDGDYAKYNNLPAPYKILFSACIQNNLIYSEKCWTVVILCTVLIFPGMATCLNVYNFTFKSEPTKYMVHDINKPNSPPEARFESPFFEVIFAYSCYCAVFYIINYTGFDGFFGITINHACLKMDIYCKAFEEAMRAKDIHNKLADVIRQQSQMFMFVELIQDTFSLWLGVMLIATMIQICNCMYQITEGGEVDPRYIVVILGTVVHMYLPCRYSAKLKHTSLETSTKIYCGGWECVRDVSIRRSINFLIARGQVPLVISAFYLLIFDMDLFVSLLKTSYSMYTLLRS